VPAVPDDLPDLSRIDAWRYARDRIPCESRFCECPAASDAGRYSFTYVRDELNLVYYDVPKAASSYIRKEFFDNDNAYSLRNPVKPAAESFRFSVVRNPWDRMVSNFIFFCRSEHRHLRKQQFASLHDAPVTDFREFVEIAGRRANHHWQPQDVYVPEAVDFVGRMEDLEAAVARICTAAGLPMKPVYRVNTTDHGHYSEYYDDITKALVTDRYRRDIERFGYEFEDHR
jgi:hypothetical protein